MACCCRTAPVPAATITVLAIPICSLFMAINCRTAQALPPAAAPDYHVMVLLVDDQAMVCEAVRRALAYQADIDFHYCADAR